LLSHLIPDFYLLIFTDVFENLDVRSDPSLFSAGYFGTFWPVNEHAVVTVCRAMSAAGTLNMTHTLIRRAGLSDLCLRLVNAMHLRSVVCVFTATSSLTLLWVTSFDEVEATAAVFDSIVGHVFGFVGEKHCWVQQPFLISQMKRRHWLLAPNEVEEARMLEWLPPAEWGTQGQGELIDVAGGPSAGMLLGSDSADVFEALGRFEEAIVAGETDIRNHETAPFILIQSHAAIGRCHAKLGRLQEARTAFEAAIAEAFDCEIPFAEMLVRRDFIESGACPEDERATQIIALGGAISRMVLPPSEYAAVLGGGIDPEEAAAAFEAAKGG
jgi:hypothetical protein